MRSVTVFINEKPIAVSECATVRDAVAAFDEALARGIDTGSAYVTDGVGRRIEADGAIGVGGILRVVGSVGEQ